MRGSLSVLACALAWLAFCTAARANWFDDCPAKAPSQGAVAVSYDEMAAHRIGEAKFVRSDKIGNEAFDRVELCVPVDADGRVAEVLGTFDYGRTKPAVADAVRAFGDARYKPFERAGKRVRGVFIESVSVLPPERRPETALPMPELRDPSTLSIMLARGACFGTCAVYTVELRGDGSVRFKGKEFVVLPGEHRATVPPEAVRALFERFREAEFFRLDDVYRTDVTDMPVYVLTLRFDGHVKTVLDYDGEESGMPHAVTELEKAVDGLAGTQRWIAFGKDTIETLKREKYDVRAHPELLDSLAGEGDADAVRALIGLGVATDGWDACDALATASSWRAKNEIVTTLLDAHVPLLFAEGGPRRERCNPLADAAEEGHADIVREILARHPPKSALDQALLADASTGGTQPVGTLPLLLTSGADLEAHDPADGRTPLMRANRNAALVRILLAAGAKADARDNDGDNALVNCMDADVAELLLRAGTDPWARDKQGIAAVDRTLGRCTAVVKNWMAAHPRAP